MNTTAQQSGPSAPQPKFHADDGGAVIRKIRDEFEQWFVANAFDYVRDPLGSQQCDVQWRAWLGARKIEHQVTTDAITSAQYAELCRLLTDMSQSISFRGHDAEYDTPPHIVNEWTDRLELIVASGGDIARQLQAAGGDAPAAAVGGDLDSRLMNLKGFFPYNSPEWNTIHEAAHALSPPAGGFVVDDDTIARLAFKHLQRRDAENLTFERSPEMFPQASYSVPTVELTNFAQALVAAAATTAQPSAKDGVRGERVVMEPLTAESDRMMRVVYTDEATTASGLVDAQPIAGGVSDEMVARALTAWENEPYNELRMRAALQSVWPGEKGEAVESDANTIRAYAKILDDLALYCRRTADDFNLSQSAKLLRAYADMIAKDNNTQPPAGKAQGEGS